MTREASEPRAIGNEPLVSHFLKRGEGNTLKSAASKRQKAKKDSFCLQWHLKSDGKPQLSTCLGCQGWRERGSSGHTRIT